MCIRDRVGIVDIYAILRLLLRLTFSLHILVEEKRLCLMGMGVRYNISVSYTHLDVYKRQTYRSSNIIHSKIISQVYNIIGCCMPGCSLIRHCLLYTSS